MLRRVAPPAGDREWAAGTSAAVAVPPPGTMSHDSTCLTPSMSISSAYRLHGGRSAQTASAAKAHISPKNVEVRPQAKDRERFRESPALDRFFPFTFPIHPH